MVSEAPCRRAPRHAGDRGSPRRSPASRRRAAPSIPGPPAIGCAEALFSAPLGDVGGALVLDLVRGHRRAPGIEALSRGGRTAATFVESAPGPALASAPREPGRARTSRPAAQRVVAQAVARAVGAGSRGPSDLVFADPPYAAVAEVAALIEALLRTRAALAASRARGERRSTPRATRSMPVIAGLCHRGAGQPGLRRHDGDDLTTATGAGYAWSVVAYRPPSPARTLTCRPRAALLRVRDRACKLLAPRYLSWTLLEVSLVPVPLAAPAFGQDPGVRRAVEALPRSGAGAPSIRAALALHFPGSGPPRRR